MNLKKQKSLARRTLKAGRKKIVFLQSRQDEIKEAITKKDIKDLHEAGAIIVKEVRGRRKKKRQSARRSVGNIKKHMKKRKKDYVLLTRKLRAYVRETETQNRLSKKEIGEIRKKIRNKAFRSKAHLKEYVEGLKK